MATSKILNPNYLTSGSSKHELTKDGLWLVYVVRGNVVYGLLGGTPTVAQVTFAGLPKPLVGLNRTEGQWGYKSTQMQIIIDANTTDFIARDMSIGSTVRCTFSYPVAL